MIISKMNYGEGRRRDSDSDSDSDMLTSSAGSNKNMSDCISSSILSFAEYNAQTAPILSKNDRDKVGGQKAAVVMEKQGERIAPLSGFRDLRVRNRNIGELTVERSTELLDRQLHAIESYNCSDICDIIEDGADVNLRNSVCSYNTSALLL